MTAAPGWMEQLLHQLEAEAPADVLLLAPPQHPIEAALGRRLPQAALTRAAPDALPSRRFALALVVDTLETLPVADARALLAALRDLEAPHVVLWMDLARAPLDEAELRALGFRLHARDGAQALFGFELYDYKDRPEWLSPQHWAHPELWDRFRW
jgi:Family of unknown function (DUF6231)